NRVLWRFSAAATGCQCRSAPQIPPGCVAILPHRRARSSLPGSTLRTSTQHSLAADSGRMCHILLTSIMKRANTIPTSSSAARHVFHGLSSGRNTNASADTFGANRAHKRIRYPKCMPSAVETSTTAAPDTAPVKPPFESWGRYPVYDADVRSVHWQDQFPRVIDGVHHGALPVGMGRSYGDVCLLKDGTLVKTTGMNRLLGFNPDTGVLTAEAGITLAQILAFAVPRGFFLPVTPGTKYVTLGGAIANDIHGKNHHIAGTFGCHVPQFELVRSDGARMRCSPTENPDMYSATIGGLGLTGMITWAQLRLKP